MIVWHSWLLYSLLRPKEGERLVAVQSNRWIYWTKSIFLKMERVLPSGSMGCNLVVTSSDNQLPPPPLSFQPPLREPLSSKRTHLPLFSRVKRNIYTFSARLYGFKSLVTISLPDVLFSQFAQRMIRLLFSSRLLPTPATAEVASVWIAAWPILRLHSSIIVYLNIAT